jgi:hypothetical protein
MALKGDRQTGHTVRHYSMDVAGERGLLVIADSDSTKVKLHIGAAAGTEKVMGLLLDDVEDLDFTSRPELLHRNVVPLGSQVSVTMTGEYLTNMIPSGVTVLTGDPARLAADSKITNTGSGAIVGKWLSEKDADGFAHLALDTVA